MTTTDDRDLDLFRKSARELARRFDLGYWPVLTFDEAARHPHNAERGVFERVGSVLDPSPAPRLATPRPGPRRAGDRARRCAPAPRVLVRRGDNRSGGSSWLRSA